MSENSLIPQNQLATAQSGGSLAASGQFVVAPVAPLWATNSSNPDTHSTETPLGNTEYLPTALQTSDPIQFTGLMRTIHSLAISVFGSNLSELNAAKEFQAILAARQQTANIAKGIIDSSLASSSDNIH